MEKVITLGKLIGLLFCSLPSLYFVFENSKNTRNELARPVMGTIFLVDEILLHAGKWCTWEWKKRKVEERVKKGRSEGEYIPKL